MNRFDAALKKTLTAHEKDGIGTLSEGTLHAVIKNYLDPDEQHHEKKLGRYICDIYDGDHVFEIQTRQLFKLEKKLFSILSEAEATIVFPIAVQKRVFWLDTATGEVSGGRRTTKKGVATDVLHELYGIRNHLTNEKLDVLVLLFSMDEYRNLNGWGRGGKRGSSRHDRIPTSLEGELVLRVADDYRALIPSSLGDCFSAKEFARLTRQSLPLAYRSLGTLSSLGIVSIEKQGRTNVYRLV